MSFLKKLGGALLKGLSIVSGVTPYLPASVQPAVTLVTSELTAMAQVVAQMEAVGQALNLAGPQKLIAAAPGIEQIILTSSLMVGKKVADETKFKAAVNGLASNMADLLNSLHADAVTTDSKT